jgi:hypothetical protein
MSPENTNKPHTGVPSFLGNVFLKLVIQVPIQTVPPPHTHTQNHNYLVLFTETFAQTSIVPSNIAHVSIGLEGAGHSECIFHCILEPLPVPNTGILCLGLVFDIDLSRKSLPVWGSSIANDEDTFYSCLHSSGQLSAKFYFLFQWSISVIGRSSSLFKPKIVSFVSSLLWLN